MFFILIENDLYKIRGCALRLYILSVVSQYSMRVESRGEVAYTPPAIRPREVIVL